MNVTCLLFHFQTAGFFVTLGMGRFSCPQTAWLDLATWLVRLTTTFANTNGLVEMENYITSSKPGTWNFRGNKSLLQVDDSKSLQWKVAVEHNIHSKLVHWSSRKCNVSTNHMIKTSGRKRNVAGFLRTSSKRIKSSSTQTTSSLSGLYELYILLPILWKDWQSSGRVVLHTCRFSRTVI